MNAGIVASRYAKALLKFVQENGTGKKVYSQSCALVACMNDIPQLREYIMNASDVSLERKQMLLSSALGEPLESSIVRFLIMVSENRRVELFPRMLLSFIEHYRKENDIKVGSLVTAVQIDGLRERIENIFHVRTGAEVHLEERVDEDIIGGFVFELDGCRVDASVDSQLKRLKRHLVEKNNRIV